ncbi:MAG: phosphoglycerate kinase [Nanobdellota archaeon]
MKTMDDIEFKDKIVLVRLGSDVPMDEEGNITDDSRIRISLPTINELKEAKKIILMCHLGRPKDNEPHLKTDRIAERLGEILGERVEKVDGWDPSSSQARIVFLENLRFNKAEKSKDEEERDEFGKKLASLADVFVQDAFSNCHRKHASMTSVPKFIESCAGRVVQKELEVIEGNMSSPERPFISIIGGVKADKLETIGSMLKRADKVLIGGALAFSLLKAKGYSVGRSKVDDEGLEKFRDKLKEVLDSENLILPEDALIADEFSEDAKTEVVDIASIKDGWLAVDIGPKTLEKYKKHLAEAGTIIWNGPIGAFEIEKFSCGTRDIAEKLAETGGKIIVGGGDSSEAIHRLGLEDKMTHVSSGGGASLKLFEGKELVAVKALE